jgi:hypothetical protein
MKNQAINNLEERFEQTWAQLAREAKKNKIGTDNSEDGLKKLLLCLKWSTAYSVLQSQCIDIIKPFHKQANTIVKWFWVEYNEHHNSDNVPPTPKDFFEWYCDSDTIKRESKMYKKTKKKAFALA